jgi:hypothetical protein
MWGVWWIFFAVDVGKNFIILILTGFSKHLKAISNSIKPLKIRKRYFSLHVNLINHHRSQAKNTPSPTAKIELLITFLRFFQKKEKTFYYFRASLCVTRVRGEVVGAG